jgi:ABC-2 type transport system permease protein
VFAWSDLLSSSIDWSDIARGVLSSLVYCVIFVALAGRRFATKDITS